MRPRVRTLLALLTVAIAIVARRADAQPMAAPPPSGIYESWSPVRMGPVGPIDAPVPRWMPRWLEVETEGRSARITFAPERRVVWRARWGPHGVVVKDTEVDGERWAHSEFVYRNDGCLDRKTVTDDVTRAGGSPGSSWTYRYRCDGRGRVVSRTLAAAERRDGMHESLDVQWSSSGSRGLLSIGRRLVRRDDFDPAGRTLRTMFFGDEGRWLAIRYRRDRRGPISRVESEENLGPPDTGNAAMPAVSTVHVHLLAQSVVELHEAKVVLGEPVHTTDEGRGTQRRVSVDWAPPQCWLNSTSGLAFDPAGLLVEGLVGCICGFCVDAALAVTSTSEVLAVDTHRTRGPWVRLDDAVDVTADHEVVTPSGPRRAGSLRAGEIVIGADGRPRPLRSVETLPSGPLREGRNLRTRDGTFSAGGILFRSELPGPCSAQ